MFNQPEPVRTKNEFIFTVKDLLIGVSKDIDLLMEQALKPDWTKEQDNSLYYMLGLHYSMSKLVNQCVIDIDDLTQLKAHIRKDGTQIT